MPAMTRARARAEAAEASTAHEWAKKAEKAEKVEATPTLEKTNSFVQTALSSHLDVRPYAPTDHSFGEQFPGPPVRNLAQTLLFPLR